MGSTLRLIYHSRIYTYTIRLLLWLGEEASQVMVFIWSTTKTMVAVTGADPDVSWL